MRERTAEIRDYMLKACRDKSLNVASDVAREFGISRQAALRHLHAMEEAGLVKSEGQKNLKDLHLLPLQRTHGDSNWMG